MSFFPIGCKPMNIVEMRRARKIKVECLNNITITFRDPVIARDILGKIVICIPDLGYSIKFRDPDGKPILVDARERKFVSKIERIEIVK